MSQIGHDSTEPASISFFLVDSFKKGDRKSVWIDDVPGGEQYEVQKISNTATKISTASDLTTTTATIASCVSSLRPSNKTLLSVHQVNDSPA